MCRRCAIVTTVAEPAPPAASLTPAGSPVARLVSLDIFRGMTIAGMILVNNPGTWGHIYAPLRHADWHGWTPTDLVFSFFLFIVGVSMVFSFTSRQKKGDPRSVLFAHVARRSSIIFALGLFLNGFPFFELATLRIPGVLQRIAVCYLFAALIVLTTGRRGLIVAICALLVAYWAMMTFIPVPGYGVGRLDAVGNLAAYLDRWLMSGHLWKPAWDPEGMLSTLPAIATTLLGALAGQWLRSTRPPQTKAAGMLAMGAAGLLAGQLLHPLFPINKNLWTSSYVVFTAGFALVLLGVCYWLVDVKGYRRWGTSFVILGVNAIAVFTLSGLVARLCTVLKTTLPEGRLVTLKTYVFESFFAPLASPVNASLLFALAYVLSWLGAMWLLYRRRIFIRI